jgi:hypothetical protein
MSTRARTSISLDVCFLLTVGCCLFSAAACEDDAPRVSPVPDPEAAARAFKLFYAERVERAVIAYNRFMLFGDTDFGVTIGKAGIARTGDDYEVVPGPTDNNMIGISTWTVWHAYQLFRSRPLALSLVRMFNGLAFMEAVSGHPGLTSRMVYPGWTRVVDGVDGEVVRTRDGAPAVAAETYAPELAPEILKTFFDGVRITYREDPADFLFSYMPAVEVGPYAVTYSFSDLPRYLRSSDCCCSLMRTPAPYAWEGAYWGNHNSRDNFPDLALGLLAARQAMDDEHADPAVRAAARRAHQASLRIGDLIQQHAAIMTVDEHHSYGTLIASGTQRPDGETEVEDLGKLADCSMAFLSRALSSDGLGLPLPELALPASIEFLLVDTLGAGITCEVVPGGRTCTRLEEAYCGFDWSNVDQMKIFGKPWLDVVRALEESSPGTAGELIGGFQDDYYEITLAMLGLVVHARVTGDAQLLERARKVLAHLTALMRTFADILYAQQPERLAERLYQAALFDAWGGDEAVSEAELGDFAVEERYIAALESWLALEDTAPAPLLSDEEIRTRVEQQLSGASETVKQRYKTYYGDQPPIRRSGEGYEARGVPEDDHPWQPVERPHHRIVGGIRLLHALPLCTTAPKILDCTWAKLGCARPDLNADGRVDDVDAKSFAAKRTAHVGQGCYEGNGWCAGADLDRTGKVDKMDAAFMDAAKGCHYTPK